MDSECDYDDPGALPGHRLPRTALGRLYELRYWAMLWMTVETAAIHLVSTGDLDTAAVVLSHLVAHQSANPEVRAARDSLLTSVLACPESADRMRDGSLLVRLRPRLR